MVLTNTIHRDRDFQGVVDIHSEEIEEIVKWYCHSKSRPNRRSGNLTNCGLMWYNGIESKGEVGYGGNGGKNA